MKIQAVQQHLVCANYMAKFVPTEPTLKAGVALATLNLLPLNALRHPPADSTCGWYIWGGGDLGEDPEFFQPLHAAHLPEHCPEIIPYLGLAPGWRVLLAPGQTEVWYDAALLNV